MSGSRRELKDRECGLTFSWRSPEVSGWNTCAAVVLVSLLATAFLGIVRVRITPPPRIIERHAGIVMVPAGGDAQSWAISIDEQGPFPARFEVASDPSLRNMEREWLGSQLKRIVHRPSLRDLPADSSPPPVSVSLRGQRVFPSDPPVVATGSPAAPLPLRPLIRPLSNLPESVWPSEFPAFDQAVPVAVSSDTWRFMLQLGGGGRVVGWQPIEPADDEASASALRGIGDWLGRLKFGSAAKPGWIGVEVSFTRGR